MCVLIDEPELHLHPSLQQKVLDYLRVLTTGSSTQVIVATHSVTIVEAAASDELFLLRPIELVSAQENQLVPIATNEERLQLLREAFGSTSNATAMQPIVVVEGVTQEQASRVASDRKLYRALHPQFDRVTLLSGGGKNECVKLLDTLNNTLNALSPQLSAVALLDKDVAAGETNRAVKTLPVSMIENFLLDPVSLWEALQSVRERTGLKSVEDVERALTAILDRMESQEVERRVKDALGIEYFRPVSPLHTLDEQIEQHVTELQTKYSRENIATLQERSRLEVQQIRSSNRKREEFHGKDVLNEFIKSYMHKSGLPKSAFLYLLAKEARNRKSVQTFFAKFFAEFTGVTTDATTE